MSKVRHWLLSAALSVSMIGAVAFVSATATATATAKMPSCQPIAAGDNVHWSNYDASGHGWWLRGNCSSPAGQVGIVLWEWWISDHTWHNMASNIGTVYSGGGSGRWVNARAHCNTADYRYWHSEVSVVVTGGTDTINTPNVNFDCRD